MEMNYIVYNGNLLCERDCIEDAIGLMRCAVRRLMDCGKELPSKEELETVLNSAILYETKVKEDHYGMNYEDTIDRQFAYKATKEYLDGLLCVWDGAGDGLYCHNDKCTCIRNKILSIYDDVQELSREEDDV